MDIVTDKTSPKSGTIKLVNGQIQDGSTLTFDDTTLTYKNNKWVIEKLEETATIPDDCFITNLIEGEDLTDFNETYGTNYTTPVVSVVGYACGNSLRSFNKNSFGTFDFDSDGKYTNMKIPEELPLVQADKVTQIKKEPCMSLVGDADACSSLSKFTETTEMSVDEIFSYINLGSQEAALFDFTTKIVDSTKYPVVKINVFILGLDGVEFNSKIKYIFASAFNGTLIKEVTIPENITVVDSFAFMPGSLEKVVIEGDTLFTGEGSTFSGNKITSVDLGNKLTKISYEMFKSNQLTSITIPSSVKSIGENAFGDNKLTSVIIEGKCSTSDFESYPSSSPFGWADGYSDANIVWKGTSCN